MSDLRIVPVSQDQAFDFIRAWHRHHEAPQGYKFAAGVALGDLLVGVAVVGRPVARALQDGLTVEVTRVATDGTPNSCSMLYGACWRAAKALGFRRAITYTQDGESGASLRAAGWVSVAQRKARHGWDMPGRRRDEVGYSPVERWMWVAESGVDRSVPSGVSMPALADPAPALFDLAEAA